MSVEDREDLTTPRDAALHSTRTARNGEIRRRPHPQTGRIAS